METEPNNMTPLTRSDFGRMAMAAGIQVNEVVPIACARCKCSIVQAVYKNGSVQMRCCNCGAFPICTIGVASVL